MSDATKPTDAGEGDSVHRLVLPLSDEERAANRKALQKMHVGNRFRLMFGMPLLPEPKPAHRRMEVDLGDGVKTTITGDPNMPEETAKALHEMMIALKEQAEAEGILGQNVKGMAVGRDGSLPAGKSI